MYTLCIIPVLYGELKHSGSTANAQPLVFASFIRLTALAMFADLSAVTVICNKAARRPFERVAYYCNEAQLK